MSEHYMPQSSSSSSAAGDGRGGGGLYVDAYEVSFPIEDNTERPPAYLLNHGQQMVEGGLLWISYWEGWFSCWLHVERFEPVNQSDLMVSETESLSCDVEMKTCLEWFPACLYFLCFSSTSQNKRCRSLLILSTAPSSWFPTCGLTCMFLWRRTPGCRSASRNWRRRGTSCAASWTASLSAWGIQTVKKQNKSETWGCLDFPIVFSFWIQWVSFAETRSVVWRSSLPALRPLLPPWPPGPGWPSNASRSQDLGPAVTWRSQVRKLREPSLSVDFLIVFCF